MRRFAQRRRPAKRVTTLKTPRTDGRNNWLTSPEHVVAGISFRSGAGSCIDPVLRILGADVPATSRLRNRSALSSDRAPRRFFWLPSVLVGAAAVGSGERGRGPPVLVRRLGLVRW